MKWAVFGFWALITLLLAFLAGVIIIALAYIPQARTWETIAMVIVLFTLAYLSGCFAREAWGEWEHER